MAELACENPECGRLFAPPERRRGLPKRYCCSYCRMRVNRLRFVAENREHMRAYWRERRAKGKR